MVGLSLLAPASAVATVRDTPTQLRLSASSLHVHADHVVTFLIRLRSSWKKCRGHQSVRWYRNGVYHRTVLTSDRGWIRMRVRMHRTATFQARYPGRTFGVYPNRYTCLASSSREVTVAVGG